MVGIAAHRPPTQRSPDSPRHCSAIRATTRHAPDRVLPARRRSVTDFPHRLTPVDCSSQCPVADSSQHVRPPDTPCPDSACLPRADEPAHLHPCDAPTGSRPADQSRPPHPAPSTCRVCSCTSRQARPSLRHPTPAPRRLACAAPYTPTCLSSRCQSDAATIRSNSRLTPPTCPSRPSPRAAVRSTAPAKPTLSDFPGRVDACRHAYTGLRRPRLACPTTRPTRHRPTATARQPD